MRVIGTAGHVDHGKSTLVKRLTGIDPDRLAEEKARHMTIDLGFAWLKPPDGETVGIVDVPGHRDFIENMLAGVGGIDAVLLVVAADEGVMPQTREHLAILDLLGVEHGFIVLTKIDLVDDEWLALVEQDVREAVQGTTLAEAQILPVSAPTGAGIDSLVDHLTALLATLPRNPDQNAPRLPIDRVFTMSGFGTVVTGTLIGGSLRVGDEIELQPTGLRGRIRGLQSYHQPVEVAHPGSRVAVNVSGIDRQQIARGDVLSLPGQIAPTELVDVRFRHLPDVSRPLKHNVGVKVYSGAAEAAAHVRLLGDEILAPGTEGWLQLRLDTPMALAQGDRFILRYPSPGQTIGGGVIVEPHPERRHKRFQPAVIEALETRMQGTPAERITQAASTHEPIKRQALQQKVGYPDDLFRRAVDDALTQGALLMLSDGSLIARASWQAGLNRMIAELRAFHEHEPLRAGMSREELRSRMRLKNHTLALYLEAQTEIVSEGTLVRLASHQIKFNEAQTALIATLREQFAASPYAPPSVAEAAQLVGEDVLHALIELGEIVQVQPDVIFSADTYRIMVDVALRMIDEAGSLSASAFRDHFGTTRKYAIGLLEHLDSLGITKRVGDGRVRGSKSR
jgi:selenocysteine-specific elongation factor